jgi:hypothetical protein
VTSEDRSVERQSQAEQIGKMLQAFVYAHERDKHAGQICETDRLEILAYLAHGLGVFPNTIEGLVNLMDFIGMTKDYAKDHLEHIRDQAEKN